MERRSVEILDQNEYRTIADSSDDFLLDYPIFEDPDDEKIIMADYFKSDDESSTESKEEECSKEESTESEEESEEDIDWHII